MINRLRWIFITGMIPAIWVIGWFNWEILLILLLMKIVSGFKYRYLAGIVILGMGALIINPKDIPIVKIMNFKSTAIEVNKRFEEEHLLQNKIKLPKFEEKLAYNRYSLTVRNFIRGSFKVVDFDNLFFQENNPKFEKSIVMFTWIWIWVFILGLIKISGFTNKNQLYWWISMSFGFYWLFSGPLFVRQIMMVFPLALVINHGWNYLGKVRLLNFVFILITIYAFTNSMWDLYKNKEYWFGSMIKYEQNY